MTSIPPSPTFPTVHSGPGSGISARQDAKKRTNESGGPDETGVTTSFRFAREHLRTSTAADCPRSLSPSRPNGALGTYPEGEGVFDSPELDMALRTPQTLGHWSSSSTIEEDDEDSNRAAYPITKELGCSSTQVGQRLLDATMRNKTILLVTSLVVAHLSLSIGVDEDSGSGKSREPDGPLVNWVDGVTFLIALSVLKKNRRCTVIDKHSSQQGVKVVRGDLQKTVQVEKLVVGDIVLIESGDAILCDGILITGQGVKCDESGSTGVSDVAVKTTYCSFTKLRPDCFMISGSRVIEGSGRYVVVAAPESATIRTNMTNTLSLEGLAQKVFPMLKPDGLAEIIVNIGSVAAWTHFASFTIRHLFLVGTKGPVRTATQNIIVFVAFLTLAISMVAAVGSAETCKRREKSGQPPLNVNFYDHSNHTIIRDSYNAKNKHTTNSNNDNSARYSATGPSGVLPIADQRRYRRAFIQPTYASHYSKSPELQPEHLPPISQYAVPPPISHQSFGSHSPLPPSVHEPIYNPTTPIIASHPIPPEGNLSRSASL